MSERKQRVGILGAGQLALMLAEAARALPVEIVCAGAPGDCAEAVATVLPVDLDSREAVRAFAAGVDVVTIESENIDAEVLVGLPLAPNARAIAIAQDRLFEKRFFGECGISVAPFAPVESMAELEAAVRAVGLPGILKTRRLGYDGKGQVRLAPGDDLAAAWAEVGEVPCLLEGLVRFDAEVSLVAARRASGEIVFYPLTRNWHREGILRVSRVPVEAPMDAPALQAKAERYMRSLLEALEYVGVLAVEFFVRGEELVANEMAPRVHNSGHWTIEGSRTSQFENHLRALLDLPLGSTASEPTAMLNCIGTMPPLAETERFPRLFRHDYGKEPRPGRKVGHLTFPASEVAAIREWEMRLGDVPQG